MDVSVIIVNYNTADLLPRCIESVLHQQEVTSEIIVVDNQSTDNSLEVLSAYADRIRIIKNKENQGFGRANNVGASKAQGDYLFLLNPDAAFENTNDLKICIDHMRAHPECGLSGPKIWEGDFLKETLPKLSYPGEKHIRHQYRHLPGKIAWLVGAAMCISRELFLKVEGFDPDYFLYGEEVDLCLRIRSQGYEIQHIPFAIVKHIGGASERKSNTYQTHKRKQNGLHLFYQKNYCKPDALRLVKKEMHRAWIRMKLLLLQERLQRSKDFSDKIERYRAIYDTSRAFLIAKRNESRK